MLGRRDTHLRQAVGTEPRNVASWRRASRSPGRTLWAAKWRASKPTGTSRVVALPVPDLQDAVAMPMFQWPQSPCHPPNVSELGAVALLDGVERGLQPRHHGEPRPEPRPSPAAGTSTRSLPGRRWSCPPGRATSRIAANRARGGHRLLGAGRQRRHHQDLEAGPAPVVEQLGQLEGTREVAAERRQGVGLAAHERGRQVVVPHLGVAQDRPVETKTWSTGFWLTLRVPSMMPTRTSIAEALREVALDRVRARVRRLARAASATGPARTRASGRNVPAGCGPGRPARTGPRRAVGAWSTRRAGRPGPAAAGGAALGKM